MTPAGGPMSNDSPFNDFALIIGVESYDHADRVPGAVNDALAYLRRCLAMGFSPDRIWVLTSPALSPDHPELLRKGGNFGEAPRDAIRDRMTWFLGALGASAAPVGGLLAFSGHGLQGGGVVLFPSDFDGSADRVVRVSDVMGQVAVDGESVPRNLTMLL